MSRRYGMWMLSVAAVSVCALQVSFAGPARAGDEAKDETATWGNDCSAIEGWIDSSTDPEIGTTLQLESGKGILVVRQDGKETWGKTAILVNDVDLNKASTLEMVVTQVDKGSAFKVGIAPTDWSDFIEVLKRSSADGTHKGDIEKAVKRANRKDLLEGPVSFYLVIVVEGKGKAAYVDEVKIRSGK
ncbi:MAG: hypothetical protein BWY59_00152 [Verrucomicrobia bacterium ADurb.Bin345]|nr:MAG: hypothetical protein BWY59_00152 [Verrucomicrobia bacterium ADurb.Bin345]